MARAGFRSSERWCLGLVLGLYIALGVLYSVTVPLWESPDEYEHFWYVRYVATRWRLPSSRLPSIQLNQYRDESRQPPLYYLLGALITARIDTDNVLNVKPNPHITWWWVPEGKAIAVHTLDETFPYQRVALAVHLLRWVSVALGATTIGCVYLLARQVMGGKRVVPLLAAAVTAFMPGYLFIHASVNNDNLVALMVTLVLLVLLRISKGAIGNKQLLLLGCLLGLAMLSKQNALLLLPFTVGWLVVLRTAKGLSFPFWKSSMKVAGTAALIAGWWYVYKAFFYSNAFRGELLVAEGARGPLAKPDVGLRLPIFVRNAFESFWGVFGWQNVRMDTWVYWLFGVVVVAGVWGLLRGLKGPLRRQAWLDDVKVGMLLLGSWVAVVLAASIARDLATFVRYGEGVDHGRFLYPAIGGIAPLLALGWSRLDAWRHSRSLLLIAPAGALVLAAVVPFVYIRPAYIEPLPVFTTFDGRSIQRPLDVSFDNGMRLLGYSLDSSWVSEKKKAELTLYWQAVDKIEGNVVAFAYLVNQMNEVAWQSDRPPGGDWYPTGYPTHEWLAGEVIRDRREIAVVPGAKAGQYKLTVGLYRLGSDERIQPLPPQTGLTTEGDTLVLQAMKVAPAERQAAQPQHALATDFGGEMELLGYDLGSDLARSGEPLAVTLFWRGKRAMEKDYTVSVQLLDESRKLVAQADSQPQMGLNPTSIWDPGELVLDQHVLRLDAEATAGNYTLLVAVYYLPEDQRLPVRERRGGSISDSVMLQEIRWTR